MAESGVRRVKARLGCNGAADNCAVFIFITPASGCACWQREPRSDDQ